MNTEVQGAISACEEKSCSILAKEWKSEHHTLLVFMVYVPFQGLLLLDGFEVSDQDFTKEGLLSMFVKIIERVGDDKVLHIVTRNVEPYVNVAQEICKRFPSIPS